MRCENHALLRRWIPRKTGEKCEAASCWQTYTPRVDWPEPASTRSKQYLLVSSRRGVRASQATSVVDGEQQAGRKNARCLMSVEMRVGQLIAYEKNCPHRP